MQPTALILIYLPYVVTTFVGEHVSLDHAYRGRMIVSYTEPLCCFSGVRVLPQAQHAAKLCCVILNLSCSPWLFALFGKTKCAFCCLRVSIKSCDMLRRFEVGVSYMNVVGWLKFFRLKRLLLLVAQTHFLRLECRQFMVSPPQRACRNTVVVVVVVVSVGRSPAQRLLCFLDWN